MPLENTKATPRDDNTIDLQAGREVRYWSNRFGVTPYELREAVKKVGNAAEVVQSELATTGYDRPWLAA